MTFIQVLEENEGPSSQGGRRRERFNSKNELTTSSVLPDVRQKQTENQILVGILRPKHFSVAKS